MVATGLIGEREKQTSEKKNKTTRKTNFLITCDFHYAKIINFTIHTQLFLYKNGYYYSECDKPTTTTIQTNASNFITTNFSVKNGT